MANGTAFEQAISLVHATPTLDVGIHLTLVEEQPLSDKDRIPSLLNKKGLLQDHATTFTKKYFSGEICLREVRCELEAQIQRVLQHGVKVSHLDSHQHLHMLPQIWHITVSLAQEYAIPAIRLPHEPLHPYMLRDTARMARIAQLLGLNFFCQLGSKSPVLRPQHFAGFFFGGHLQRDNLRTVLQHLPATGTCELMCHPGLADPNTAYRHWKYQWADELTALTDPAISDFLKHQNIHLISYRQLVHSPRVLPARPTVRVKKNG
jgi:predicted glycoside hydrolase/deacetylase ChbG (UPF0249 family)